MGPFRRAAQRKLQHGVTLIELLVTAAILAVLIAVVAPGLSGLIKDARLSSQTDALVAALNLARLEAISRRADVTLCATDNPDATSPVCSSATTATAVAAAWGNGWLVMMGTTVLQRFPPKNGVTYTPASTTAKDATFSGTLGSASGATQVTLCLSGRKQQAVTIAASGHVSKSVSSSTTCV
ncbi:GspH/FimT family pseudopilin [Uliginosibacterium silvisoli]|uniref:GspH/FimT family pseudopilin n=1 Tax=Uliginosibacterium silvisoli TaxID=3114758 RepID=UPI003A7F2DCE